jgi:PAS domain S-box-containing protein
MGQQSEKQATEYQKAMAARLRKDRQKVLDRWCERVMKEVPAARVQNRSALFDSLPKFLRDLEKAIVSDDPQRQLALVETECAKEHGQERATLSQYSLDQVVAEYGIFRQVLIDYLEEAGRPLESRERDIILDAIFLALKTATVEFVRAQGAEQAFAQKIQAEGEERYQALKTTLPNLAFRALFEASPGLYLVLDRDLNIVAVSEAYLEATMTTREGILSKNIFNVFPENPVHPNTHGAQNFRASFERVRNSRTPDIMTIQKYDIRRPDGHFEERYWAPVNTPVLDSEGELLYIINRVEDVTDYITLKERTSGIDDATRDLLTRAGRMEAEIYQRSQDLRQANLLLQSVNDSLRNERELREQVMNLIAHDLRGPLTAAKASAQLIARRPERVEAIPQLAVRIAEAMNRADRMIQDLLDASRLRAGKGLTLQLTEVSLSQIVRDISEEFSTVHGDRFVMVLPDEDVIQKASAGELRRAIENLLSNAVKYGYPGTPITLGLGADEQNARIWVHNFGPVIPLEEQPNLFRPFTRRKEVEESQTRGWGLGLALVAGVATAHSGRVRVNSSKEAGTTFTIELPRQNPSDSEGS